MSYTLVITKPSNHPVDTGLDEENIACCSVTNSYENAWSRISITRWTKSSEQLTPCLISAQTKATLNFVIWELNLWNIVCLHVVHNVRHDLGDVGSSISIHLLVNVLLQRITKPIYDEVDRTLVVSYTTGSEIQEHQSAPYRPDSFGSKQLSQHCKIRIN